MYKSSDTYVRDCFIFTSVSRLRPFKITLAVVYCFQRYRLNDWSNQLMQKAHSTTFPVFLVRRLFIVSVPRSTHFYSSRRQLKWTSWVFRLWMRARLPLSPQTLLNKRNFGRNVGRSITFFLIYGGTIADKLTAP